MGLMCYYLNGMRRELIELSDIMYLDWFSDKSRCYLFSGEDFSPENLQNMDFLREKSLYVSPDYSSVMSRLIALQREGCREVTLVIVDFKNS